MLTYRKASAEDARVLVQSRHKAWVATYRGIMPDAMIDEFDFSWHVIRETKCLQNPAVHTYLVMDGDECAGYFTYIISPTPLWRDYLVQLKSLYLLPQWQGRGEGRRIFETIKDHCRRAGQEKIWVSCYPSNRKAMGFYTYMGGKVVAEDLGHREPVEDSVEFEFIL